MIIIADASPLNYLVLVGEAEILSKLFGRVLIPAAVLKELQQDRTPEIVRRWISTPPAWLEVRFVQRPKISEMENLGEGEREAIWLAEQVHADWLIIDDYDGRREAARRHLPIMGTLRVVDEAASQGLINLTQVLARFEQTTFFISPDLVEWLLDRDAKRKKQSH